MPNLPKLNIKFDTELPRTWHNHFINVSLIIDTSNLAVIWPQANRVQVQSVIIRKADPLFFKSLQNEIASRSRIVNIFFFFRNCPKKFNPKNNLFKCKVFKGFTKVEVKFELVQLPMEALFANKFSFVSVETCEVSKTFQRWIKTKHGTLDREGMKEVGEMNNGLVCLKIVRKSSTTRVACLKNADI